MLGMTLMLGRDDEDRPVATEIERSAAGAEPPSDAELGRRLEALRGRSGWTPARFWWDPEPEG